jgi:hypothetical protein
MTTPQPEPQTLILAPPQRGMTTGLVVPALLHDGRAAAVWIASSASWQLLPPPAEDDAP